MVMPINLEFVKEVGPFTWLRRTFVRQFSKRILGKDNSLKLPTGLRMRLPTASKFASEVFITGSKVDWGSEELFVNHLNASEVVLDVGANIGYYSLYVLPRTAAVHAFEPDPRALDILQFNLAPHANAHIHRVALGKYIGKSVFILEPNCEVSHLAGPSNQLGGQRCEVDVTTIDQFVSEKHLHITGIKIDVEGADLDVIEGAVKTLTSQAPLVLTETTPDERLFEMIRPLGYKVFAFIKPQNTSKFQFQEIVASAIFALRCSFWCPPGFNRRSKT